MISCHADESGQIMTLSYGRDICPVDTCAALKTMRELAPRLKPGFILLSDLTNLDSMAPECARELGAMMELLSFHQVATVIRVIPDPSKDIGFNIISLFHFRHPVKVHTLTNLADAIKLLLTMESPPPVEVD